MTAKSRKTWLRSNDGVTAIEFSLLAMPFILTIVAIIELSLMFAAGTVMAGAVNDAARLIRTGQLQQAPSGDAEEMFKDKLCELSEPFLDCDTFQYQVQKMDAFSDADMDPPLDEDGNLEDQPFDPGGISDVVMVRVIYLYPYMTPLIGAFFSDYPGNKKMLMTTTVFETEPYDFE